MKGKVVCSIYTINEIAEMSGLSTRTLRSYLKSGILEGEKVDGVWRFSSEQVLAFLNHPSTLPSIEAKRNALVYDFMSDRYKKINSMCMILDLPCDQEESVETMQFFCDAVNRCEAGENLKLAYAQSGGQVRVILTGAEECVMQIMQEYYG